MTGGNSTSIVIEQEEIIQTPEERLVEIDNKLTKLDGDLESNDHYINDIMFTKKKDFFNGWAELIEEKLIIQGQVDQIQFISNQIRLKLKSTGHDSAISNMYEQLGTKYKSHKQSINDEDLDNNKSNSEIGIDNSSKINQVNFEEENSPYMETIDLAIDFLKLQKLKLKTESFLSKLDPDTFAEENHILRSAIQFGNEVWDNRQSVPTSTQFLLAKTIAAETINHGSGLFLTYLKKYGAAKSKISIDTLDALTSKQSGKILKGNVRNIIPIFEPKNRDEAIFCGFYGNQCEHCMSFRVIEISLTPGEWNCKCFNCTTIFDAKSIMKCPSCHLPLDQKTLEKITDNKGICITVDCVRKIMFNKS